MNVSAIKRQPPPPDPLRVQLQEAIKNATEAREALDRHKAAADKTRRSMWAAEKAHATALSGIDKAIGQHAETIAAAAADADPDEDTAPASSILHMARLAVANAADEAQVSSLRFIGCVKICRSGKRTQTRRPLKLKTLSARCSRRSSPS
jgi:hypothetical protein